MAYSLGDYYSDYLLLLERTFPLIYYTADTHFGDEFMITAFHRPFQSVQEMNLVLVKNWNETVKEDDIVFHLGDLGEDFPLYQERLNGRIFIVAGNHDLELLENMEFTPNIIGVSFDSLIRGDKILSHIPLVEGVKDQEYYLNLHGHIHLDQVRQDLDWWKGNRWYNVGMDMNALKPISNYDIQFYTQRFSLKSEKEQSYAGRS